MGHAAHATGAAAAEAEGQAGEAACSSVKEGGDHQFAPFLGGDLLSFEVDGHNCIFLTGCYTHLRRRKNTSGGLWATHTLLTSRHLRPALGGYHLHQG